MDRRMRFQQHSLVIVMRIDGLCFEEALLNRREWNGTPRLWLAGGGRLAQPRQLSEFGNRLMLKNMLARQLCARAISTRDDLYAQNGITAEFEEVVMDSNFFESQHISPDFCQRFFDLRAWCYVAVAASALLPRFRREQSATVHLSVTCN